jgi:uncharacterized protein (TIGR02145 family)
MKKILILFTLIITCFSCQTPPQINSVVIGSQEWTSENLDVETFKNGDLIPHAITNEEWLLATENKQPAWCYYNNNPTTGATYGKLYNWYAVNDPRGLAPDGWHIPSEFEWMELFNYLGGESIAGGKMKSTGTQYWLSPNTNGTNQSGFSGLPGGYRTNYASFENLGNLGYWWSSTEYQPDSYSLASTLTFDIGGTYLYFHQKSFGFSVRCIKD